MAPALTNNAINILNGGNVDLRPLLQVMDIRQIGNATTSQERYRLVLSDGVFVQQAMLATQLNDHVMRNEIVRGTIVQLTEYICNSVQSRKIIIVLNWQVLHIGAEIVGDPVTLASGAAELSGGPRPPKQQQQQDPSQQSPSQQGPPSPVAGKPVSPQRQQSGNGGGGTGRGGTNPPAASGGFVGTENGVHGAYPPAGSNVPSPGLQGQRQLGMNSTGGRFGGGEGGQNGGGFGHTNGSSYGKQQQPSQPSPMYSMKGPISRNEAPARIVPIAGLNPYQGRWTIKARVTTKGDMRRFHNARGDGKVFSFDCLDADGGEIRCTCFNSVADQFFDKIDIGRVYLISKGSLKPSQKQFNHLKNDWEITLENGSTVELSMDEDGAIPQQVYDFRPISDVESMENNAMVDIVGVVLSIQDPVQIMRKNGTEALKRTLMMMDQSGRSVELTLWGAFCNKEGEEVQRKIQSNQHPILVIKAGRVSDFSGKSVGTLNTSHISINPNIPEVHKLRSWHNQDGKNTVAASISREGGAGVGRDVRKFVTQIKDENLGRNEKPDWISVRATVSFIKADNFCYTACPLKVGEKQCSKKVTNNGDGSWQCDRCEQSVEECDYRYLLNMQVQDQTGLTWVSGFQEAGEEIFGVTAKELFMWKQDDNPKFGDTVQRVLFSTFLFKLKVKEETFQDEPRVKVTVVRAEKPNFSAEGRVLIDSIRQLERGEAPYPQQTTGGFSPARATPGSVGGGSYPTNSAPSSGGAAAAGGAPAQFGGGGGSTFNNSGNFGGNGHGDSGAGGGGFGGTPNVASYGASNNNSGTRCFKCGKEGHFSNSCPNTQSRNDNYLGGGGGAGVGGGAAGGACYKCGQGGHFAKDCPSQGGGRSFKGGSGGGGGGGLGGSGGFGGRGY